MQRGLDDADTCIGRVGRAAHSEDAIRHRRLAAEKFPLAIRELEDIVIHVARRLHLDEHGRLSAAPSGMVRSLAGGRDSEVIRRACLFALVEPVHRLAWWQCREQIVAHERLAPTTHAVGSSVVPYRPEASNRAVPRQAPSRVQRRCSHRMNVRRCLGARDTEAIGHARNRRVVPSIDREHHRMGRTRLRCFATLAAVVLGNCVSVLVAVVGILILNVFIVSVIVRCLLRLFILLLLILLLFIIADPEVWSNYLHFCVLFINWLLRIHIRRYLRLFVYYKINVFVIRLLVCYC